MFSVSISIPKVNREYHAAADTLNVHESGG